VISAYIALRFEWKYAVPVLIALMHDLLITSGVYALTGREVTTSTVAALLTILGYSMYDTIIVFDRVRENVPRMPRAAFSQIVNRSMSEVLTRSLATSFCTLLPVTAILLFGGSTLKDFAFAMIVGIASGAYSSIFIASPVLTHWKEREGIYRNRRARIVRDLGYVPAYATVTGDGPVDVEPTPKQARKLGRRSATSVAEDPGEQLSKEEFDELVAEIGPELAEQQQAGRAGNAVGSSRRGRRAAGAPQAGVNTNPDSGKGNGRQEAVNGKDDTAPTRDPTADLTPEDLVLKQDSTQRGKTRRSRNRRHGRSR
jgi:SecD/SecF fusion protein